MKVHDCFSIAGKRESCNLINVLEIQMYEALGFAEKGKGIDFVKDGHSLIEGKLPINTGGGLIGFGHPVGATGVRQILEI